LSNPEQTFREAVTVLKEQGVMVNQMSSLWQSPAWPPSSQQPDYINAVGRASFLGVADELLQTLHGVEARFGRMRSVINAARVLDLDLLSFGDFVLDRADIQVPHPRMMDRLFNRSSASNRLIWNNSPFHESLIRFLDCYRVIRIASWAKLP